LVASDSRDEPASNGSANRDDALAKITARLEPLSVEQLRIVAR
jgi:hypothetical protein